MSMAVAYAAANGLELDQELSFHDIGMSAYRGRNADEGKLAHFVEAVESGHVPQGSLLLVEQLDRISRLTPLRALDVLRRIVDAGVSVVTLNDGRVYTSESLEGLPMDLLVTILTFTRANEESATKAKRLKAAWENKRAQVASRPLTGVTPAWLRLNADRSVLEVIEERAELVRRIFQMTLEGIGQGKIAATFNEEGIRPWGRGKFWRRSYIVKVTTNPAVIGTLQPHTLDYEGGKRVRRPLDIVEGYFPPVVSPDVFRDVQAMRRSHGAAQRGRHSLAPIAHPLAGLAVCSLCGSTMTRVNKGARSRPSYVCSKAKAGAGCSYHSLPCAIVEHALRHHLPERLRDLEGAADQGDLGVALHNAEQVVDTLKERAADIADTLMRLRDLEGTGSRTLAHNLKETETDLELAEGILRDLLERQRIATGATVSARVERALEALEAPEDTHSPGEVSLALRKVFDRAVFKGSDDRGKWRWSAIEFEWKHGGDCALPLGNFGAYKDNT